MRDPPRLLEGSENRIKVGNSEAEALATSPQRTLRESSATTRFSGASHEQCRDCRMPWFRRSGPYSEWRHQATHFWKNWGGGEEVFKKLLKMPELRSMQPFEAKCCHVRPQRRVSLHIRSYLHIAYNCNMDRDIVNPNECKGGEDRYIVMPCPHCPHVVKKP